MPSGGQNKKSSNLKLLEGTERASRKRRSPKPRPEIQKSPPSWLPSWAKAFWRKYASQLVELGILTEADRPAFEELCLLYDRIRECHEILQRDGLTVEGRGGHQVKHPLVSVLNAAENQFRLLSSEFGLTPSSRGRLDLPVSSAHDAEWDELLNMEKMYRE